MHRVDFEVTGRLYQRGQLVPAGTVISLPETVALARQESGAGRTIEPEPVAEPEHDDFNDAGDE